MEVNNYIPYALSHYYSWNGTVALSPFVLQLALLVNTNMCKPTYHDISISYSFIWLSSTTTALSIHYTFPVGQLQCWCMPRAVSSFKGWMVIDSHIRCTTHSASHYKGNSGGQWGIITCVNNLCQVLYDCRFVCPTSCMKCIPQEVYFTPVGKIQNRTKYIKG